LLLGKEIPRISLTPKVYYRVKKNTPIAPILRHTNPEKLQPCYLLMIHFNIIFPCTPISYHLRGLFPSSFFTITLYVLFSSPCHMSCLFHPLKYWHPNNTWVAGIAWLQARWSGVQTSLQDENFWTNADQPQGTTNLLYN